jgi:hypothetical protein
MKKTELVLQIKTFSEWKDVAVSGEWSLVDAKKKLDRDLKKLPHDIRIVERTENVLYEKKFKGDTI